MWWCSLAGCLLGLLLLPGEAKIVQGSFKVSPTKKHDRVHYITQFACSIGECRYRVRAGVRAPVSLVAWAKAKSASSDVSLKQSIQALQKAPPGKVVIRVVLDDEWDTSHHMAPCDRAELGRGRTTLQIPLNGTIGKWSENTFRQTYRPHFWYFFAEDCRNSVTEQLARAVGTKTEDFSEYELFYEMEIFQADGSHLSFENVGMIKWNLVQLLLNSALLAYMVAKQMRVMKGQRFRLHLMCQVLNASLVVSIAGNLLRILHLMKDSSTGLQWPLIDGLAENGFLLSQVCIGSCLILIAMGVTLNAPERMPLSMCSLIGAVIGLAHFAVVLIDKYVADMRFKYYASEGRVGHVLILFRFALWGLFLVCWHSTRTDKRTPGATELFLRRLLLPSTAYFLTFPLLLTLTGLCKPYWRHAFFFHTTFLLQLIATFWLAETFLTKGEYFRVSQMSQSFLPGGVWRPIVATHHIE